MTEQQTHWQNLKQQAIDGELQMDYDAGSALRNESEALLTQLQRFRDDATSLSHLAGYGGLPSALDIKKKFELKAAGGENGDSAVTRLDEMIEVVTLMRDTYAAMIGELQETDQQNSSQTAAAGEGLH
ncbi:hypothetical protein [Nocardia sienata]|uniref:hypothetical protein n=1 Tax=Nocardia sienata TaxID=248552 RepID=UPI0007A53C82|nr:hypothetical protein [Nocardia sienata]